MISKKFILIAAPLFATAAIAGGVALYQSPADALTQGVTAQTEAQRSGSDAASTVETIETQETNIADLVTITNPFNGDDTVGTTFITPNEDMFAALGSVTDYTINDNLVLPNDFSGIGAALTRGNEDRSINIIHRFTFSNDTSISWSLEQTPSNHSWAEHPAMIPVHAGSIALVTYTSHDGGLNWEADIKVSS